MLSQKKGEVTRLVQAFVELGRNTLERRRKMARKRDYHRYELKQGRKVLYRGITKDPDRREGEHRDEGKRFSHIHVVGGP